MTGERKPPPLPKLPKARKLPSMPRAARNPKVAELPIWRPEQEDEVTHVKDGFGGDEEGRWFETGKAAGSVGGRCAKCRRRRKAENLKLTTLPFGKGEIWACKEGC